MTLLGLVAALTLGFASVAGAAELKVRGEFQAFGSWIDNGNFKDADQDAASEDDFLVQQRLRTRFDFVQSENLKAVLHLEVGEQMWGRGSQTVARNSGGGLGADAVTIEVKNAYLDFNIPETVVNMKVGIQGFAFPGTVFGSAVHDNDSAGALISAPINDMFGVVFAWTRPVDVNSGGGTGTTTVTTTNPVTGVQTTTVVPASNNDNAFDETDVLLLAVPITPEGMKITPWAAMAIVGRDAYNASITNPAASNQPLVGVSGLWNLDGATGVTLPLTAENTSNAYWAGLAFELSMFDPFVIAADFNWGTYEIALDDNGPVAAGAWDEISQTGWLFDLSIKYNAFGYGTPELFFAYASGNGEDALDDGKFGTLPNINDDAVDGWSIPGSFYFGGTAFSDFYSGTAGAYDRDNRIMGNWVLGLALRDFSFLDKLTHTLIVAYIQGTNDSEFIEEGLASGLITTNSVGTLLSTKDHIWEIDFNHEYKIYEQLSAIMELGMLLPSYDEDVWGNAGDETSNAWRIGLGLKYTF